MIATFAAAVSLDAGSARSLSLALRDVGRSLAWSSTSAGVIHVAPEDGSAITGLSRSARALSNLGADARLGIVRIAATDAGGTASAPGPAIEKPASGVNGQWTTTIAPLEPNAIDSAAVTPAIASGSSNASAIDIKPGGVTAATGERSLAVTAAAVPLPNPLAQATPVQGDASGPTRGAAAASVKRKETAANEAPGKSSVGTKSASLPKSLIQPAREAGSRGTGAPPSSPAAKIERAQQKAVAQKEAVGAGNDGAWRSQVFGDN